MVIDNTFGKSFAVREVENGYIVEITKRDNNEDKIKKSLKTLVELSHNTADVDGYEKIKMEQKLQEANEKIDNMEIDSNTGVLKVYNYICKDLDEVIELLKNYLGG